MSILKMINETKEVLWEKMGKYTQSKEIDEINKIQDELKVITELEEKYKELSKDVEKVYLESQRNGYRYKNIFISSGAYDHSYILMDDIIKAGMVPLNKKIKIKINGLVEDKEIDVVLTESKKRINTKIIHDLGLKAGDFIIFVEIEPGELYEMTPLYQTKIEKNREKVIKNQNHKIKCDICNKQMNVDFVNETFYINQNKIERCISYICENNHRKRKVEEIERDPKCPKCGGEAYVYDIDVEKGLEKCICRNNLIKECNYSFTKEI